MRGLWVLGRTLRVLSVRVGRRRRRRPGGPLGSLGPQSPGRPGDPAGGGEVAGDPLDEADRRRAAVGRSWFVGGNPPAGGDRP